MKKFILVVLLCIAAESASAARYHGHRRSERLHPERVVPEREAVPKKKVVPKKEAVPVVIPVPLGPKKLIAVAEFENKTNWSGQVNLGTGMADQLITALMNTGRFIVLERQSIQAVLREQDFGASGRTTEEGGGRIGDVSRAQILIQGAITEFEQRASGGGGGFSYGGVTITSSEAKAHVAVDVRVYDTTTGQILASKACKGAAKASGGGVGFTDRDWGFAAGGEARAPLDFAVRDAITQAVDFIIIELQSVPWEGRIAMVKGNDIYINCGRTTGIFLGDQFSVYKPGEAIVDPETGLILGSEKALIGRIEVVKVEEKFSKAVPMSGAGFDRNDILKYEGPKPAAPPPPAEAPLQQ